jgi:hypothetical protein
MKYISYKLTILLLFSLFLTLIGCTKAPSTTTLSAFEIFNKSYDSLQAVNSFHFLLDHTGGGTPITNGIEMTKAAGDVLKPDKMQAAIDGTAMGFAITVKLVSVGDKTLMTNPLNGKWESPSAQFQVFNIFNPATGIGAITKGITNPSILAEDQIDSTPCYHLKGTIVSEALRPLTGNSITGVSISSEVWIGKLDFLMRQVKLTGKITDTEKDGIVRTLILSNFNQQIDITLPQ